MKKLLVLIVVVVLTTRCYSENNMEIADQQQKNMRWNFGLTTKVSQIESKTNVWLGISGAYKISNCLEIGLKGEALHYDYKLNKLDAQKSYHLQSAHIGFFADWHPFGTGDIHFSIPLYFGQGEISYIYDKEYRKELLWKDEIIDKTNYHIWQLGIELEAKISAKFSLAVNISYLSSSPIEMLGTDENILNQFQGGLSLKYNIFE